MTQLQHTRETVLARIAQGPVSYIELSGSRKRHHAARAALRAILEELKSEKLIRRVLLDRFPFWVLYDWQMSDELKLQLIEGKCRRRMDGCLDWTGYIDDVRGPMHRFGADESPQSLRRAIWVIRAGRLKPHQTVKAKCGNPACVEFTHLVRGQRNDESRGTRLSHIHRGRIAKSRQERHGKLNWEKVRAMRALAADPPSREALGGKTLAQALALEHGVSLPTVYQVLSYRSWQEPCGMFTSLIAGGAAA